MEPMLEALREVAEGLSYSSPGIPIISNLSGEIQHHFEAGYWLRQARQAVRFQAGIEAARHMQVATFLECGPVPALSLLVEGGIPSLGKDELSTLMAAAGKLHERHHDLDWKRFFEPLKPARVALPSYAFQRQPYWVKPLASGASAGLYRAVWQELPDPPDSDSWPVQGCWLVAAELEERWREAFSSLPIPVRRLSLEQALEELSRGGDAAPHLLYLPDPRLDGVAVCAQALRLAQAVRPYEPRTRLVMLTRQALAVSEQEALAHPQQQALWGFGRALSLERPGLFGGLLDLPSRAAGESLARALGHLLAGSAGADELAIRQDTLWTRRLQPARLDPCTESWRPAGPILITGGTGYLASKLAFWLAEQGAETLLLASRRGPAAASAGQLAEALGRRGCQVQLLCCDLRRQPEVEDLLRGHRDLKGIFHLAGSSTMEALESLSAERLAEEMGAKAQGAWHLQRALERFDIRLDSFVLYGSIAGFWGAGLQLAYSAANAALQGLAEWRRGAGQPATVVHWGPWPQGGMVTGDSATYLERRGLLPLRPEPALEAMRTALSQGLSSLTVANVDWPRFASSYSAARPRPFLETLAQARQALQSSPASPSGACDLPCERWPLEAMAGPARLLELVRAECAAVLGLADGGEVPRERPLQDLGLDSVMAVELRDRLRSRAGCELPSTVVFDYPTPEALAGFLLRRPAEAREPQRQGQPEHAQPSDREAIAIIGLACRAPGQTHSPETFWALLREGRDGMGTFPARWRTEGSATGVAGAMTGVELFDAAFFAISPREAVAMDPQQRLILELAWEALERAGLVPSELRRSRTGVFVGANGSDYPWLLGADDGDGYQATGRDSSVIAGRLSYTLDLRGPAMTVDTACSSSLVSLHLACRALRDGECDLALSAGVRVMCTPLTFRESSKQNIVAPDGRCKAFSAQADGAGWSEGAGVLVLKRLAEAERDGDPVLAVIRGSAVNQDGRSQGLTAPNGPSQERVIEAALATAGLGPEDVDAVEAHGTGTVLGDPIEANALSQAYGQASQRRGHPLWLGSSKSNIGHAQAAAGVLGVIKMVLALQHELLPKTLHAEEPSPQIDWRTSGLELLQEARPWPRREGRPRRAGISSFGISGTNAHVILEEAPHRKPAPLAALAAELPLLLSARTPEALRDLAASWAAFLREGKDGGDFDAVRRTAALSRSHFEHRAALLARRSGEAVEPLQALSRGEPHPALLSGQVRETGKVAFLFPGQGGQWPAMGRQLLQESPPFARAIAECEQALRPVLGWSLAALLRGQPEAPPLERVEVLQPALFAMGIGLAALWRELGIVPEAVVGHSQGEITAAVVSGALSLAEGARIVALRSRLLQQTAPAGAMAQLELALPEVERRLQAWPGLSVAVVNTASSTVVSGPRGEVCSLLHQLRSEGIFCRRLEVDYASHSAAMDAVLAPLKEALGESLSGRPGIEMISTLSGQSVKAGELDASYWCHNLRRAVRMDLALEALAARGCDVLIEIAPHPVLSLSLASRDLLVVPTLRRQQGGQAAFYRGLAQLHASGFALPLADLYGPRPGRPAPLPSYRFERRRYWPRIRPRGQGGEEGPLWRAVEGGDGRALAGLLGLPGDAPEVAGLLPHLRRWRESLRLDEASRDWLYQERWRLAPDLAPGPVAGHCWLVGPHQSALWSRALQGLSVAYRGLSLEEAREALPGAPAGLVCLYLPEPESRWDVALEQALLLAQALGSRQPDQGRLWIGTPRALSLAPHELPAGAPFQALWGFGRTLSLEQPGLWGGMVDLPDQPCLEGLARLLPHLLLRTPQEDELALRDGTLWSRRLERAAPAPPREGGWIPPGKALLSGGTGYLASLLAAWLARQGCRQVVLLSRRGEAAAGAPELASRLAEQGCQASFAVCDVRDAGALRRVLAEHPDLEAIFHLAGESSSTNLSQLSGQELRQTASAKVEGAWNLHLLCRELEIEPRDFVLYGSVAGFWGSGGQLPYAAANAALSGLAALRRSQGLSATVVHWGRWPQGGLLDEQGAAYWERRGLLAMPAEPALRALERALAAGLASLAVASLSWKPFARSYASARSRPLLSELAEAVEALREQPAGQRDGGLGEALEGLDESRRRHLLLDLVQGEACAVLGLAEPRRVSARRPLQELGLDSLMAVELRNRLKSRTGLELPSTLVFDHPTPERLAAFLLAGAQSAGQEAEVRRRLHLQLDAIPLSQLERSGLLRALLSLARGNGGGQQQEPAPDWLSLSPSEIEEGSLVRILQDLLENADDE
jgi:acyl transferase domain-containing protein/acyl carrier protein